MEDNTGLLVVNIRILQWLRFWPEKDFITFSFVLKYLMYNCHVYLAGYTTIVASIRQMVVGVDDSSALVESSIGSIDFLGFAYMSCCFFINITSIKYVAKTIYKFEDFCSKSLIMETEYRVRKYSKVIFGYGFLGNTINVCLALYGGLTNCKRPNELLYQRDPCGYPSRCFFPVDVTGFPLYWIMFVLQSYTCFIISLGVLAVTMFIVGVLIHTVDQLKHCRKIVYQYSFDKQKSHLELEKTITLVVKYHLAIIEYSTKTNFAFSSLMLFHLTVTSLIISVLGFNILIVDNITDCLRFGLHLLGWLVVLFLICFYGQQLIDESLEIGNSVYSFQWYNASVSAQKDLQLIIARAQRPLTLTALNLGVMSFTIFLKVIKAAYSYFTLFLNLKYKA